MKIGKARTDDLKPGEGAVQIVPKAFGNATATVVAGADAAGTDAAASYLARRVPYVWDNARGSMSLGEVALQANRFLQARNAAGQASQIDTELDALAGDMKGKSLESVDVKLYVEQADPALDTYVAEKLRKAGIQAPVKAASVGITDPVTVFDDTFDVPWEVDDFWAKFKSDVLPKVKAGSKVELEARLSESPAVRRGIVEQARAQLIAAGAADPKVTVLSAYKQGYLWLTEQVIPALKGKNLRAVHVKVAEYHPDLSKKYKFYMVPSRWVHELYPADEIFLRELGLPKDAFSLELVDDPDDTYVVEATDAAGKVVYKSAFSAEDRRARVSRQVSRLVARRSDHGLALGDGGWRPRRRCAHRDRPGALLGSLPVEGAAAHLRQRDEADRQPAAARQAAVPSRPRHRSLDERAGLQDRRRRGADLVARSAARGSLLRDARLLRRARPHDDQAPPGRAGQDLSDHSSRPPGPARKSHRALRRQRVRREPGWRSPTRRKESSGRRPRHARADAHRRDAGRCQPRRGARGSRRAKSRSTWRPRTIAKPHARPTRFDALARLHAAGLYRDALVVRSGRPRGRGRGAQGRPLAPRDSGDGSVSAEQRAARRDDARVPRQRGCRAVVEESRQADDHLGSHHQPRRERGDRRAARRVPGSQGLQGRPLVPRPRHLGARNHQPDDERAGVAREAVGVQADDLHHRPPARQRGVVDEPHPAARRAARHRQGVQGRFSRRSTSCCIRWRTRTARRWPSSSRS